MKNMALLFDIETSAKILIESCNFNSNQFIFTDHIHSMIVVSTRISRVTLTFLKCTFHHNHFWQSLIHTIESHPEKYTCLSNSIIIFKSCDFINNESPLLYFSSNADKFCMLNVIIHGPSLIIRNTASNLHNAILVGATKVVITMIGPVLILHNRATSIILCHYCNILFSEEIVFASNQCGGSII